MKKKYLFLLIVMIKLIVPANGQVGLVAHWSFDELNGNTFSDASGFSNHGTSYGAHIVKGVVGNALSFNGIKDYARIPGEEQNPPDFLKGLGEGSISLWFKADYIPTDYGIAPIFFYGAENNCNYFDAANQGLIIELGHSPVHAGSESLYFTIWKNGCTLPSFCFDSGSNIPTEVWNHFSPSVREINDIKGRLMPLIQ